MEMSAISLRQLRYFEAVARHGHFGQAAAECAVSQPALSMQIRDLERTLGRQLLERRPGEAVLTPLGAEIAARAAKILIAANDLVDVAKRNDNPLAGPLTLGVIPTLAPYLLPPLLAHLRTKYPALELELREAQTRPMLEELSRGQLDLVLAALPLDEPDLEAHPLFTDRFLLAQPAADPKTPPRVTAANVDGRRLILLEEGHCLRDQALSFCSVARGAERAGLGATSLSTVMQMVASGYGVTLVPQIAVEAEARDKRIRLSRFEAPEPSREIGLAWRRTSPRKADFHIFGKAVLAALNLKSAQTS